MRVCVCVFECVFVYFYVFILAVYSIFVAQYAIFHDRSV